MLNVCLLAPHCLNRAIHKSFAPVLLASTLAVLAGCGGGLPPSGSTAGSTSGGTVATSGNAVDNTIAPVNPVDSLTIALTNAAGVSVSAISVPFPATVKVTLKDPSGAVVPQVVVTFVTDATKATIVPTFFLSPALIPLKTCPFFSFEYFFFALPPPPRSLFLPRRFFKNNQCLNALFEFLDATQSIRWAALLMCHSAAYDGPCVCDSRQASRRPPQPPMQRRC